jgi:hypothetical protein
MNCRAIAPLFQSLAAKRNRLAAKSAIADHLGGFPMEAPGYFGKVGADVTMPARKGKRRNTAESAIQPLPVSIRSRSLEKAAIATTVTPNRREIARDFNKFLP